MSSSYVHPNALCETETIGERTRVWAFAHVMKNVTIGEDCNVGDHAFIESNVTIGDRVTIKNGVAVWDGVTVESDAFLGPNCVFTNDLFPRRGIWMEAPVKTHVSRGASIGANATIVAGVTLGEYCMIGSGTVVIRDVPAFALMVGNPARQIGWVGVKGEKLNFTEEAQSIQTESGRYTLADGRVTHQESES
jgi:UDP-2-acetamido-3-amino-2,3-dideoxy-glucuronate N-acetyltransferase